MNKVTWYTHSHQGTDVEYWNKTTFEGQTTALFVSSKIDKVEINSNNNVYSCTITKNNENSVTSPDRMFVYEKNITMGGVYTKDTLPRGWYANFNYHSGYLAYGPNCNPFYLAGSWSTRTFSGTLTEVFEQLRVDVATSTDTNKEIELTAALDKVREQTGMVGVQLQGRMYDMGNYKAFINCVSNYSL